ncbi:LOW QUALITY PROTEIN: leucine carboxyl methyltransferase 1-like [Xenia sp. Carnegie-2017]|uniref:LOW QUALITY PROTEIN: leucine carboxyl methyltransferase 1-like n=1 Tax=Xenia sp. Carnegie-2017 TaxID=2897299 RepID=UPI001F03445D|nr:LOW QUALITY PROTEIN: leucine carboxyl methyltransferase 1-like [Xenia sp. Carnegie-2017]
MCKRFAVHLGYWQDNYIQYFVKKTERKTPEINRGYYARKRNGNYTQPIPEMTSNGCQVINLGAGFDTRYWQLKESGTCPMMFYDVDFGAVTSRNVWPVKRIDNDDSKRDVKLKLSWFLTLRQKKALQLYFDASVEYGHEEIHFRDYHLLAADIRNITELEEKLLKYSLDKSLPTVFITECVLVYLHPKESETLIKWAGENFPTALFLNYEQVNMNDTFGQVMIDNLKVRNCFLYGALACPTLKSQVERFENLSWSTAGVLDMSPVYQKLPYEDRERIEKLEMLDEVNLFYQLLNHYCICWAINDTQQKGLVNLGFH